jgi:hypothetical protein
MRLNFKNDIEKSPRWWELFRNLKSLQFLTSAKETEINDFNVFISTHGAHNFTFHIFNEIS